MSNPLNYLSTKEITNLKFLAEELFHVPSFYDLCVMLERCKAESTINYPSTKNFTKEDIATVKTEFYVALRARFLSNKETKDQFFVEFKTIILRNVQNFLYDFEVYLSEEDTNRAHLILTEKLSTIEKIVKKYTPKTKSQKPKSKTKQIKQDKFEWMLKWIDEGKTTQEIKELLKDNRI
jgi:hypothetical protein